MRRLTMVQAVYLADYMTRVANLEYTVEEEEFSDGVHLVVTDGDNTVVGYEPVRLPDVYPLFQAYSYVRKASGSLMPGVDDRELAPYIVYVDLGEGSDA